MAEEQEAGRPLEQRLRDSAAAIRDDIRGVFNGKPEYQKHLYDLLTEAAVALTATTSHKAEPQ